MAVSYVDRQAFSTLSVEVTRELEISNSQYGLLLQAFSFAYLLGTPLSGWWIDRVGARRGLVISVLVWSVVAALHSLAGGLFMLFVLRIALGIAEGPSFPGSAQAVQRALPPRDRARGFGVLFTGSSFGGMVVPPRATFRELVQHPLVIRALVAIFAAAPIFGFVNGWGAKYLNHTFGVSQEHVGHYLWLPPLVFDTGAILFGDLASRQRRPEGAPPRLLFAIAVPLCAC